MQYRILLLSTFLALAGCAAPRQADLPPHLRLETVYHYDRVVYQYRPVP